MIKMMLAATLALSVYPAAAWSHGSAGGPGHSDRGEVDPAAQRREAERARRDRLEALQEKIDKLEAKLDDPALSPKKRAKLEKKLKKLFDKKDRLHEEP